MLRDTQSNKTSFKTKARWFEFGEKSNKYFLNLNKRYKKQKVIDKIECEGVTFRGQAEVSWGITDFYKKLYTAGVVTQNIDNVKGEVNLTPWA